MLLQQEVLRKKIGIYEDGDLSIEGQQLEKNE